MLELTRRNGVLWCHDKIVHFDLKPWNIPSDATELWINVSLEPSGIGYEVFLVPNKVFCDVLDLPIPLAFEIFKKVETYTTTTIYLEVWYA